MMHEQIVVLLIKPIAFVALPLPSPSPSSDLKVSMRMLERKQKRWKLIPLVCSRPNFLDEVAPKRLLDRQSLL